MSTSSSQSQSESAQIRKVPLWLRFVRVALRFVLTLLVCLIVLEFGIRFYVLRWNSMLRQVSQIFRPDPATGFALAENRGFDIKSDRDSGGNSWRFATNGHGLRGPDLTPRVPGECRLLMLGGSYTFGVGVDEAKTAPALLEAKLRAKFSRPIRVFNAGAPAFGLKQIYGQYLSREKEFDSDGVILPYLQRDDLDGLRYFQLFDGMLFTDPILFAGHPSFLIEFFAGDNIYVHRSYEPLRYFLKHVLARHPDDIIPRHATSTYDPAVKSWEVIQDIQKLADSRHQPFLLANFPYWEKSRFAAEAGKSEPPHARTPPEPWAQDFFPLFWNAPASLYLEGDHHWNEHGHELVADALLPWASEVCGRVWARAPDVSHTSP